MPKFVIPKEIKFLSTLLPESSTKDRRPFSKINSPPISVFNSVALEISFNTKNTIDFELKWDFIDDIFKLSRVVFFESPAYWSVREFGNFLVILFLKPSLIAEHTSLLLLLN
jgi:hypothetical protein